MKDTKTTILKFSYQGKEYNVPISSVSYSEKVIINRLKIGYVHFWLILLNGTWRFISDMPLCLQLKNVILYNVVAFLGLDQGDDPIRLVDQTSLKKIF